MSEHSTFNPSHTSDVPDAPGRQWSPRRMRLVGYVVGVVLVIGVATLAIWLATVLRQSDVQPAVDVSEPVDTVSDVADQPVTWERPVVPGDGLVDRSGVRIVYVAVTGDGGLIDLRYQVIDPSKAAVVHEDDNPPAIVDEATGLVFNDLLMGHSHSGEFTAGQTYYLIFENPGNLVQSGSMVSVLLGDAEVDHVEVR